MSLKHGLIWIRKMHFILKNNIINIFNYKNNFKLFIKKILYKFLKEMCLKQTQKHLLMHNRRFTINY